MDALIVRMGFGGILLVYNHNTLNPKPVNPKPNYQGPYIKAQEQMLESWNVVILMPLRANISSRFRV